MQFVQTVLGATVLLLLTLAPATQALIPSAPGFALVSDVHAAQLSERQKIDALLDDIEAHRELRFIRLGSIHSSAEAATMLRTKLRFAGSRVKTADDFIDHVASATASGHPYFVVYPDGRTVPSAQFLRSELKRLTQTSGGRRAQR